MPAASHVEKEGTFTNTQRLLQWRDKALEPPGDARSRAVVHAPPRPSASRRTTRTPSDARDWPIRNLTWDYPEHGDARASRRAEAVLQGDQRLRRRRPASRCRGFTELEDDGSTACGCWIYSRRLRRRRQPGAPARPRRPRRRRGRLGLARVGLGVAGEPAHALQPRVRRPATASRGRSARSYVWWDEERGQVDGLRRARLPGRQARPTTARPTTPQGMDAISGDEPFIMMADGRGLAVLAAAACSTARCRRTTSRSSRRSRNPLYPERRREPGGAPLGRARRTRTTPPADPRYPLRARRRSGSPSTTPPGAMSRNLPWLAELQPEMFAEIDPVLAARARHRGRRLDDDRRPSAREIEARAKVTERIRPLRIDGRTVHQVALPWHWGYGGASVTGDAANDLIALSGDPNVRSRSPRRSPATCAPGAATRATTERAARARTPRPPIAPERGPPAPRSRSAGGMTEIADPARRRRAERMGFFTDTTTCIGCKACEVACKQWNDLPADGARVPQGRLVRPHRRARRVDVAPRALRRDARAAAAIPPATGLRRRLATCATLDRWLFMSDVCKHCTNAGCLDACPTGALIRTEFETVDRSSPTSATAAATASRRARSASSTATTTTAAPPSAPSATTACRTASSPRARRRARPTRSSSAPTTSSSSRAQRRVAALHERGLGRRLPVRRGRRARRAARRRARRVLPADRAARALRAARRRPTRRSRRTSSRRRWRRWAPGWSPRPGVARRFVAAARSGATPSARARRGCAAVEASSRRSPSASAGGARERRAT